MTFRTVNIQDMIDTAREFAGSMAEEVDRIESNLAGVRIADRNERAALAALALEITTSSDAIRRILAQVHP